MDALVDRSKEQRKGSTTTGCTAAFSGIGVAPAGIYHAGHCTPSGWVGRLGPLVARERCATLGRNLSLLGAGWPDGGGSSSRR
ncbi:hypothetical protein MRX96_040603 [Rhipicephalus microplus]